MSAGLRYAARGALLALLMAWCGGGAGAGDSSEERKSGVTVLDRDAAWPGVNLFSSRNDSQATLMTLDGGVLQRWQSDAGWSHIELADDGDLLVIGSHPMLLRLAWDSQPRWKLDIAAHHDLAVDDEGDIHVLADGTRTAEADGEMVVFQDEQVVVVGPEGQVRRRQSLRDAFRGKHASSVQILEAPGPGRKGDYLVSVPALDTIAVIDRESGRAVWSWGPEDLQRPHDASRLEDGSILVFDNGVGRGYSRIVQLDPKSREIVWQYRASPPESFFSRSGGACQALPNGNVLVTETERGRAFEVTRDGRVVWEFFDEAPSPERGGAMSRMTRLPLSSPALAAGLD